jgi:hypothetical protein
MLLISFLGGRGKIKRCPWPAHYLLTKTAFSSMKNTHIRTIGKYHLKADKISFMSNINTLNQLPEF